MAKKSETKSRNISREQKGAYVSKETSGLGVENGQCARPMAASKRRYDKAFAAVYG